MGNVVMMTVFLLGDPKNESKMDFAGWNAAYSTYFGTKDQPNKPARSAVQVAALASAGPTVGSRSDRGEIGEVGLGRRAIATRAILWLKAPRFFIGRE